MEGFCTEVVAAVDVEAAVTVLLPFGSELLFEFGVDGGIAELDMAS